MRYCCLPVLLLACQLPAAAQQPSLGESGFADSGGVKIHYVTPGKGRWSC